MDSFRNPNQDFAEIKDLLEQFDKKFVSGLSNEEYKLRLSEIVKKQKLEEHVFDCRMKELDRKLKSAELALKIHEANVNHESGIEDNSGFAVVDRQIGVTTLGRKVLRLRGGASQGSDCDRMDYEDICKIIVVGMIWI